MGREVWYGGSGFKVFKGRHFQGELILLCVRWYLAYGLSLRNLEEMIAERSVSVDHSTIHRWSCVTRRCCWQLSMPASGL